MEIAKTLVTKNPMTLNRDEISPEKVKKVSESAESMQELLYKSGKAWARMKRKRVADPALGVNWLRGLNKVGVYF